jgi:hypothetical protein
MVHEELSNLCNVWRRGRLKKKGSFFVENVTSVILSDQSLRVLNFDSLSGTGTGTEDKSFTLFLSFVLDLQRNVN